MTEPWSKKHKQVTRTTDGGVPHSLSNSYAEVHPSPAAATRAPLI